MVGKNNELSDGGHFLLDAMAASLAAYEERSTGLLAKGREAGRGTHQGELRRQLATVTLRAGMQLLLSRLNKAGEGAGLRSKAHEWTLREEERMREEQWASRVRVISSMDRHKALSDLVSERRIVTHCLILQLALLSRLLS